MIVGAIVNGGDQIISFNQSIGKAPVCVQIQAVALPWAYSVPLWLERKK
jgi:hypothetical protein